PDVPAFQEHLFFFEETMTTKINTLSLHDALPILGIDKNEVEKIIKKIRGGKKVTTKNPEVTYEVLEKYGRNLVKEAREGKIDPRSEEHTSELQSRENLVCRLLLEKKKTYRYKQIE